MDTKTHDKRAEMSSLSVVSSTTTATTKSPGRARKVSMKIKKGLKEVKELLSPHHHHDRDQRRRKSGPNDSPRGPLAPVLDHLERDKLVPIHLHISPSGSLSVSRKVSSSSYSCSESSLADAQPPVQVAMPAPEPYVAPSSPQPPEYDEPAHVPDPFLVDDPENPLSDPEPTAQAPAPPSPEATPSDPVALSPAAPELSLPQENVPAPPPVEDKPVPAPPPVSDTESESEAPAVYLPQLVLPTMFLPIPNVRISSPLTWWLTRRTSVYY